MERVLRGLLRLSLKVVRVFILMVRVLLVDIERERREKRRRVVRRGDVIVERERDGF